MRHRDGQIVDGDVGRAERRPGVVAVVAELLAGLAGSGEEGAGLACIVGTSGGH
jgi:hypothetical protein